jgi:hypothetical protein
MRGLWCLTCCLFVVTVNNYFFVVNDAIRIDNKFDNDGMPQYVFHSIPLVLPERKSNPNDRT